MSKPVNKPTLPDPSVTAFEFMRRLIVLTEGKQEEKQEEKTPIEAELNKVANTLSEPNNKTENT